MNRAFLRENIFRLLYLFNFHEEQDMEEQIDRYLDKMENLEDVEELKEFRLEQIKEPISEEDRGFIKKRIAEISKQVEEIDAMINHVAVGWKTERMSKVDLTILRLAYFEMKQDPEIPQLVAVDQAVELAKKYGTEDSPKFVNGILAKFIEPND